MLNKSIVLNLKLGKSDFLTAITVALVGGGISVFMALFSFHSFPISGIFFGAVGFLFTTIFLLKGMNIIFNKSLFAEGGDLLMTLPLTPKEMVFGKLLAVTIAMVTVGLVALLAAGLSILLTEDIRELTEDLVLNEILTGNISAGTAAALLALMPSNWVLITMASCSILFTALLLFNLRRPGSPGLLPWILYFGSNGLISLATEKVAAAAAGPYTATLVSMTVSLGILFITIPACCHILKTKYNY